MQKNNLGGEKTTMTPLTRVRVFSLTTNSCEKDGNTIPQGSSNHKENYIVQNQATMETPVIELIVKENIEVEKNKDE